MFCLRRNTTVLYGGGGLELFVCNRSRFEALYFSMSVVFVSGCPARWAHVSMGFFFSGHSFVFISLCAVVQRFDMLHRFHHTSKVQEA